MYPLLSPPSSRPVGQAVERQNAASRNKYWHGVCRTMLMVYHSIHTCISGTDFLIGIDPEAAELLVPEAALRETEAAKLYESGYGI